MFGITIQTIGLILLGAGICIEIIAGAEIGYIAITLGASMFAVGVKIKHRGKE